MNKKNNQYHLHIYEVKKKYEYDAVAETPEEARQIGVDMWKKHKDKLKVVKKDCNIIVLGF